MPSFKHRSADKELLDRDDIPFGDIKKNMQELDTINSLLGGHAITLHGFKKLLRDHSSPEEKIKLVEIGCGGGDNLRVIRKYALRCGQQVELTGIDINPECIAYARSVEENTGIEFICSDYAVGFSEKPDIIFSSLFCHHFSHTQLVAQLKWMKENSLHGFFINDLHRHPLAYYSIQLLTRLFSKSYLVKNDAPISVLRGFSRRELKNLLKEAGLERAEIEWKWAFRWLVNYRGS